MEATNYTHAVTYYNYKVKAWRSRRFTTEAAATEFFNVRMARALKNTPTLSSGWASLVIAQTPRMRTL